MFVSECLTKYLERFAHLMKRLEKRKTAAHSWNILQQSLTLNQTCGDLLLQFEQMDINLSMSFLDRTKAFLGTHNELKRGKKSTYYFCSRAGQCTICHFTPGPLQRPSTLKTFRKTLILAIEVNREYIVLSKWTFFAF